MRPKTASTLNIKEAVEVHLGAAGTLVGRLTFVRQGARELSQFNYDPAWLAFPGAFDVSPDLPLGAGYLTRRAPGRTDSVFHDALAFMWRRPVRLRWVAHRWQLSSDLTVPATMRAFLTCLPHRCCRLRATTTAAGRLRGCVRA